MKKTLLAMLVATSCAGASAQEWNKNLVTDGNFESETHEAW